MTGAALGRGLPLTTPVPRGNPGSRALQPVWSEWRPDAMVEDVNYTMIADVQIAEEPKTQVQTDNISVLRQEHPEQVQTKY